jgi:LysM repeat protein
MKNLVFILFLFFCPTLMANTVQPLDSVGLKEINGKYYVQHKVAKGEGLYGIARRYQSTVEDIRKANPDLGESLNIGQIVLVPTT